MLISVVALYGTTDREQTDRVPTDREQTDRVPTDRKLTLM